MCLIITIVILFINAYYISSFTSLYIDLITIDVILLNLNRCLLFFRGGVQMSGGCLGGGANVAILLLLTHQTNALSKPVRITIVSHRGHNCIFSVLTILDSALTS